MIRFARIGLTALAVFAAVSVQAQIRIGQTAGFTGTVSAGVKETTLGAQLLINAVNVRGGIHGQKIELISMDDKFDPKLAAANAQNLIEGEEVLAMFLNRGTPHTEAIIPVLDKFGVALIGPSTGAMLLHQPVRRHVFNVRATYQREAEKAVQHLASIGIERISLIHVDDSFGADALMGAQKGLMAAKLTALTTDKFDRAQPDFSGIALNVARSNAQAVFLLGSGNAVVEGVRALRAAGSNAQIVTLSNNASTGFIASLGNQAQGVIVTQVFPNERSIAYPLVKEAQELARLQKLDGVSPAMLEGFAAAKVLVEALRRAGPKLTRDKVRSALEGLRKFDIGGLEITYGPDDHTGLDFADLSIIGSDGKFRR